MTQFDAHFKQVKLLRLAIIDNEQRMIRVQVATPWDGKELFKHSAPLQMLYSANFIFDLDNDIVIKSRWSESQAINEEIANTIQLCGRDYGLVEFIPKCA